MRKCFILAVIIIASFFISSSVIATATITNVTPFKCQQLKYKEAQTKRNLDKKIALNTYNTALKKATVDYRTALKTANTTYQAFLKTNHETYQAALKTTKEAKSTEQAKVARTAYTTANKTALTTLKAARTKANTDYKTARLAAQKTYQQKLKDIQTQYNESIKKAKEDCKQSTEQAQLKSQEILFSDKLSSCTKYKITFKHPLTGDTLEKEVLGIIDGKCNYVEQMPNGGKMECKYTENERKVVAQYYKDVTTAKSVGTSFNLNLGSGEQKNKYMIDGKEVENPLQEATNNGVCVISGY